MVALGSFVCLMLQLAPQDVMPYTVLFEEFLSLCRRALFCVTVRPFIYEIKCANDDFLLNYTITCIFLVESADSLYTFADVLDARVELCSIFQ